MRPGGSTWSNSRERGRGLLFGRTSTGPNQAEDVFVDLVFNEARQAALMNGLGNLRPMVRGGLVVPVVKRAAADAETLLCLATRNHAKAGGRGVVHVRATSR